MSDVFWCDDAQWAKIAPLLPVYKGAAPRVDDRRVLSGIVHVLISGCRWRDAPAVYGPRKTLYNGFNRGAGKGIWQRIFAAFAAAGGPPLETMLDSTHVKVHRCAAGGKKGALRHAIETSRGGRNTKIHLVADAEGRPRAICLTPGNTHDIKPARQASTYGTAAARDRRQGL